MNGKFLGTGFLVTESDGLTCAHNTDNGAYVLVRAVGTTSAVPATVEHCRAYVRQKPPRIDGNDVAVVRLHEPLAGVPAARLGSTVVPPPGTTINAFGHLSNDDLGRWVRLSLVGTDGYGGCLQVESTGQAAVTRGFSGGPALETRTGAVVGMVTAISGAAATWLIPMRAIVAAVPWIAGLVTRDTLLDIDFVNGMKALLVRDYSGALQQFERMTTRSPELADGWFYRAVARMGGRSPRAFRLETLKEICRWLSTGRTFPHQEILLALIQEDGFASRGFEGDRPSYEQLLRTARAIDPLTRALLLEHIRASECVTWDALREVESNG